MPFYRLIRTETICFFEVKLKSYYLQ